MLGNIKLLITIVIIISVCYKMANSLRFSIYFLCFLSLYRFTADPSISIISLGWIDFFPRDLLFIFILLALILRAKYISRILELPLKIRNLFFLSLISTLAVLISTQWVNIQHLFRQYNGDIIFIILPIYILTFRYDKNVIKYYEKIIIIFSIFSVIIMFLRIIGILATTTQAGVFSSGFLSNRYLHNWQLLFLIWGQFILFKRLRQEHKNIYLYSFLIVCFWGGIIINTYRMVWVIVFFCLLYQLKYFNVIKSGVAAIMLFALLIGFMYILPSNKISYIREGFDRPINQFYESNLGGRYIDFIYSIKQKISANIFSISGYLTAWEGRWTTQGYVSYGIHNYFVKMFVRGGLLIFFFTTYFFLYILFKSNLIAKRNEKFQIIFISVASVMLMANATVGGFIFVFPIAILLYIIKGEYQEKKL